MNASDINLNKRILILLAHWSQCKGFTCEFFSNLDLVLKITMTNWLRKSFFHVMPFGCLFHPWMSSEVNLEIFVKVEKKDCSAKMKAILISSKYLQSRFCHVAHPRKQHLVILQLKENTPVCTFWGFYPTYFIFVRRRDLIADAEQEQTNDIIIAFLKVVDTHPLYTKDFTYRS